MGLTVSQCERLLAQAPAEHPAGDGLYFVVGRGRAYWSYQFRRGASVGPVTSAELDDLNGGPHGGH